MLDYINPWSWVTPTPTVPEPGIVTTVASTLIDLAYEHPYVSAALGICALKGMHYSYYRATDPYFDVDDLNENVYPLYEENDFALEALENLRAKSDRETIALLKQAPIAKEFTTKMDGQEEANAFLGWSNATRLQYVQGIKASLMQPLMLSLNRKREKTKLNPDVLKAFGDNLLALTFVGSLKEAEFVKLDQLSSENIAEWLENGDEYFNDLLSMSDAEKSKYVNALVVKIASAIPVTI